MSVEDQVSEALHREAQHIDVHPIAWCDIERRAESLRRAGWSAGRSLRVAAAIAAVVLLSSAVARLGSRDNRVGDPRDDVGFTMGERSTKEPVVSGPAPAPAPAPAHATAPAPPPESTAAPAPASALAPEAAQAPVVVPPAPDRSVMVTMYVDSDSPSVLAIALIGIGLILALVGSALVLAGRRDPKAP